MGNTPLRVLVVGPSLDKIGGQSIQADLIVRRLQSEHQLDVRFQAIDPRLPGLLLPIQNLRYVRTIPTIALYCAQLWKAVAGCDVVHAFSASYLSFVLAPTPVILFARLMGKPVILNYHSGEALDHLIRWPSALKTLRLADRIVVPSGYLMDVFGRFGLTAHVVHNAVDVSAFRYRARDNPKPKFVVNRSFEKHYNVGCAVRAFGLLQESFPDASLTLVGEGSQRGYLEMLVRDLRLRNVRFAGRIAPRQMPAIYDAHDVWLNASDVDNMPISILEAFASGVAVVTTDSGGIPYMVANGRNGLLVKQNDHEMLAQQAMAVIRDPQLHAELTRNGLRECAKYTWESIRGSWITAYSEMARLKGSQG